MKASWAGVLLALILVSPATASEPLAGITSLEGSTAAWTQVRLDAPLSLDLFDENRTPQVSMDGDGNRLLGFVLRREGESLAEPGLVSVQPAIAGIGVGFGFVDAIGPHEPDENFEHYPVTLPAGEYRLYLVADGKPGKVTLTMPGLAGERTVRPEIPATLRVVGATRRDEMPLSNLAAVGATGVLARPGLAFGAVTMSSAFQITGDSEFCVYRPGMDATVDGAFTRGCPGGESFGGWLFVTGGETAGASWTTEANAKPGTWGFGGNWRDVGVPPDVGGLAATMEYEPAPPAPQAKPKAKAKKKSKRKKRKQRRPQSR